MHLEVDRHHRWRRVVLQLRETTLHDSGWVIAVLVGYFFEVSDAPRVVQRRVIWQTNVKETRVFLCHELVHVVLRRPYEKQVVVAQHDWTTPLGLNALLVLQDFQVLVLHEVVVPVLLLNLVVRAVVQFAEDEAEED